VGVDFLSMVGLFSYNFAKILAEIDNLLIMPGFYASWQWHNLMLLIFISGLLIEIMA